MRERNRQDGGATVPRPLLGVLPPLSLSLVGSASSRSLSWVTAWICIPAPTEPVPLRSLQAAFVPPPLAMPQAPLRGRVMLHHPSDTPYDPCDQGAEGLPPRGNVRDEMPPVLPEGLVGQDDGPEVWGKDRLPTGWGHPVPQTHRLGGGRGEHSPRYPPSLVTGTLTLLCT